MTCLAKSFLFLHCNLDHPSKNAATSVTMHTPLCSHWHPASVSEAILQECCVLWRVANRNGRRSRALLLGCRGPMAWLPDWSMAHVLLLPASINFMRKSQVTACRPDMNCARCLWMRYFLWLCYIEEHRFGLLLAGSTEPTLIPLLIGGCKARAGKCLVLNSETRAVRPI